MIEQSTQNNKPLSVSAALALAKEALESCTVTLIGEVSELSNKPGYKAVYFTVKDEGGCIPCMMWLNRYGSAGVDLRVGMMVQLTGRFSLYAPKGRMNFDVFKIALAGEGNLRLQVANLAKKLMAEGLMKAEIKRPLPSYPHSIGLVTSPRGAAVHDVLRTLRRRFPLAHIKLSGVAVEGETAAQGIIQALHTTHAAGVEVILLVRGGGSFEDLMPFNDENLARTIVSLPIPIVTGIGHEPDTTIADMVADHRASTPTAAAETVSPAFEALQDTLTHKSQVLSRCMNQRIERDWHTLKRCEERPLFKDTNMLFAVDAQTLDYAEERLQRAIPLNIQRDKNRIEHTQSKLMACGNSLLPRFDNALSLRASRLHDLSPLTILGRGYSVAKSTDGSILKSVMEIKPNDKVSVDMSDGSLECVVETVHNITNTVVTWEEHDG